MLLLLRSTSGGGITASLVRTEAGDTVVSTATVSGGAPPASLFALSIDGIARLSLVRYGSLEITDDLNARNTCRFTITDRTATVRPQTGQEVIVLDDNGIRIFAGTIEDPDETMLPRGEIISANVTAVDFNQLPDRFLVAEVYEAMALEAIANHLVTTYLAGDGVTVGTIDSGPIITRKVFSYVPLTDALNWLTEQSGYAWEIDYHKVFTLRAPGAVTTPFTVDPTTCISLHLRKPRGMYRNRQYIRAGRDLTDPRTESFKGDGTRRTFNVSFPVGAVPTATVNAGAKTVGIRGVETGKDWYWNKDSNEISQDDAGTLLTTSDTLAVTYRGLFPILVQAQLDTAVVERQSVEGGSGTYEAIESFPDIDDADMALDTAYAKLQRDGALRETIEIVTDEAGMQSGQLAPVSVPRLGLSGTYLVQSVRAIHLVDTSFRYSATLISGDAVGGWLQFYQRLMSSRQNAATTDTDNEVLLLTRSFGDAVICGDSTITSSATPETRIGFATVGYGEIG